MLMKSLFNVVRIPWDIVVQLLRFAIYLIGELCSGSGSDNRKK